MSLLTDASLIVTPNGYNVNKLYSVIPNTTLGDMDVSRSSSATRVNSAGLIEIARTNLLTYSNTFTDASWTKSNITVTANATTAPDLTLTANKLTITTTFGNHQINRLSVVASSQCAMSIYAKADGVNTLTILDGGTANNGSIFNLSTVTVTNVGTGVGTMVSVGGGWYRCITIVTTTGFRLYCPNTSSSAGDGTSGIYIWGAQLELGETATEYIPTTTVARTKFAGITQDGLLASNIPRIDYPPLGGCPSILVEPARTNLVLRSQEFDNASWTKTFATITANTTTTTAPDGTFTADKLVEDATNNQHRVDQTTTSAIGTNTFSVFAKKSERDYIQLRVGLSGAFFDLTNGTTSGASGGATSSIVNYNSGWYKCSIVVTSIAAAEIVRINLSIGTNPTYLGNGTSGVFLWGAQVEVGSYATSYIPTTTAAVPRDAELISRNNIYTNGLLSASGGTWFMELNKNLALTRDGSMTGLFLDTDTNSFTNGFNIRNTGGNSRLTISKWQGTMGAVLYITTTDTTKIAIKWNGTTADIFENGTKVVTATSFTPTAMQFLKVNSLVGIPYNIKQMALFKTPLTDDQCILLTGPSFSSYPEMASALIYTLQ